MTPTPINSNLRACLLAILLCISSLSCWARVKGGLKYSLNQENKTAIVTGMIDKYAKHINIPATVTFDGVVYRVTSVARQAMRYEYDYYYDYYYHGINVESITIADGVTSIGDEAFIGANKLTSITIPKSVTKIGHGAFSGCNKLKSVNLSDDNPNYCYADSVIYNKNKTELVCCLPSADSISIAESVTSIADKAFSGCSLRSITIPENVTSIGDSAFYRCNWLMEITIPENVSSIGRNAFCECDALTSINVSENNKNYCSVDGIIYNKEKTALVCCPESHTPPHSVQEDKGSDEDNEYGNFYFFRPIDITIPEGVTTICDYAFQDCYSLANITIPESVTSIGHEAFSGCRNLRSITIPESVTSIGHEAFSGCRNLRSITIPESVASIGDGAFKGCYNLTSVNFSENNKNYCSVDGVLYDKGKTRIIRCPNSLTGRLYHP